jgi:hypothetical protein
MHFLVSSVLGGLSLALQASAVLVPTTPPSNAKPVDSSLVSVSIEFFTFPAYTNITATANCLTNLAALRGTQPAVRIGGTTQCVPPRHALLRGASSVVRIWVDARAHASAEIGLCMIPR